MPGMQGMPHLMRQRKDIPEPAMVIQQHIRMCAVSAPGIRARALSLIFININPPIVKSFLQKRNIILTKRRKPPLYDLFCLLK